MSIIEKLDDYLIKKVSKGKVKHLFMVSKKTLFDRIYELNNYIDQLEWEKEALGDKNKTLTETISKLEDKKTIREEISATEKELQQMKEQHKINKTELAYQGLLKKCEELQAENKDLKTTLNIAETAIENTSKQNKILKEKVTRLESTSETLETFNKKYREELENKKEDAKLVNHSFTKRNNNHRSNTMITRQVNN